MHSNVVAYLFQVVIGVVEVIVVEVELAWDDNTRDIRGDMSRLIVCRVFPLRHLAFPSRLLDAGQTLVYGVPRRLVAIHVIFIDHIV